MTIVSKCTFTVAAVIAGISWNYCKLYHNLYLILIEAYVFVEYWVLQSEKYAQKDPSVYLSR